MKEKKQSWIDEIPEDWEVVKLGDKNITDDLFYGITAKAVENDTGLRLLRTTDIKNYSVNWNTLPFCEITEKRKEIKKYLLKKGDIIVARAGTVGISVLIERDFNNIIFGSYLIKVKLKPNIDAKFVHYFFQSSIYWKQVQKAQGSTVKNINLPLLTSLKISLPPLSEQKAIAQILSTVDEAIQKVDEIIAKTERLKKGLMQKLLTKGIGHKEFKDTEIGRIPKEWEVVKLSDIVEVRRNKKITGIEKIAFISMESIPDSEIFCKYEIRNKGSIKSSTYCEAGDLLLAKITPSLENGKQGIVPLDIPNKVALCTTEVFPINCKHIDRFFLFYLLKFSKFRNKIIASMIGTTGRQRASKDSLENLKVFLPPELEQQKIIEILLTVDKKLELERKRKEKLERIKKSLMNDLLTGRKRVKQFVVLNVKRKF